MGTYIYTRSTPFYWAILPINIAYLKNYIFIRYNEHWLLSTSEIYSKLQISFLKIFKPVLGGRVRYCFISFHCLKGLKEIKTFYVEMCRLYDREYDMDLLLIFYKPVKNKINLFKINGLLVFICIFLNCLSYFCHVGGISYFRETQKTSVALFSNQMLTSPSPDIDILHQNLEIYSILIFMTSGTS